MRLKRTGYGKKNCPYCGRFMSAYWESGGWNMPDDYPGDTYWLCSCECVVDIRCY